MSQILIGFAVLLLAGPIHASGSAADLAQLSLEELMDLEVFSSAPKASTDLLFTAMVPPLNGKSTTT